MKLPNPLVATPDGNRRPLWTLLPDSFVIVGLQRNPLGDIHLGTTTFWEELATGYVYVLGPEQTPPPLPPGVQLVVDVTGQLGAWCRQQGGEWVVVRPDRHVFGVYDPAAAPFAAADLRAALAGRRRPRRNPPAENGGTPFLLLLLAALLFITYLLRRWTSTPPENE